MVRLQRMPGARRLSDAVLHAEREGSCKRSSPESIGRLVEVSVDDSVILKVTAIIMAFTCGFSAESRGYAFSSLAGLTGNPSMALPVVVGFLMLVPGIILSRRVTTRLNPTATVVSKLDQEVAGCR